MKMLRLFFATMTFCCLLMNQANAQTITNNTPCWFEVKANTIPTGTCGFTGAGPLYGVPGGAVIAVPLPGPVGSHWVPGYGVKRPGIPVKIPGDPACGFGASFFVGFCAGAPAFATYDPATTNLDIHP